MTSCIEPVVAGITVSLISRFVINNPYIINHRLWNYCSCNNQQLEDPDTELRTGENGIITTTTIEGSEGSGSNSFLNSIPMVHVHTTHG